MSAPSRRTPRVAGEELTGPDPSGATRKPVHRRSVHDGAQRGAVSTGGTGGRKRATPAEGVGGSVQRSGLRLIGYVRVSTAAQATDNSHGLDAQRAALERWCAAEGHTLVTTVVEVGSTRDPARLYGRLNVEALLKAGIGQAVLVRDIDRASRSTLDGAELMARAKTNGWRIVGTDGTDTSDDDQELMINIRLAVAQEERRKIARRTREGLAAARSKGAVLGRPRTIPDAVVKRMRKLRGEGLSCARIAAALDKGRTPPPNGGSWSPATVRTVLKREGVL